MTTPTFTATYTITPREPAKPRTVEATEESELLAGNVGAIKALEHASWLAFIYGEVDVEGPAGFSVRMTVKAREGMTMKGYDGMYRLVRESNGRQVHIGDRVTDHYGKTAILRSGEAPHKAGASGRVYLEDKSGGYYAHVYDLRWDRVE
jgi:hypothetical protein